MKLRRSGVPCASRSRPSLWESYVTKNSIHPSLAGKVVLVTGGGSGIGAAHVAEFCAQGATVGFLDVAEDASRQLVEQVTAAGHKPPRFLRTDLTDVAALQAAIAAFAAEAGAVDVLVNNAAHDERHELDAITPEYFEERIAVNLRHLVFAIQAVAPGMRAKGAGVIVNTGSISWRAGFGGMPLYMAAKAGIEGLTRALARDLGPDGIRVNCILPGWVMTERQLTLWVDDAARKLIAERQCLGGYVEPADIARMATWLASDDSQMITNQTFVVDGGWI
ncbi:SDR family oxidoreductase [Rubellimicrobium roseum]|uniref:SDR family oxidoreductase n=2 Tax=Rubellimicrobium roseum TaxID=687525 RepID=A0A5C4NDV5_9RHOB|nr:SDR family oxidoreductase [Rubellimicrobium roseum]